MGPLATDGRNTLSARAPMLKLNQAFDIVPNKDKQNSTRTVIPLANISTIA